MNKNTQYYLPFNYSEIPNGLTLLTPKDSFRIKRLIGKEVEINCIGEDIPIRIPVEIFNGFAQEVKKKKVQLEKPFVRYLLPKNRDGFDYTLEDYNKKIQVKSVNLEYELAQCQMEIRSTGDVELKSTLRMAEELIKKQIKKKQVTKNHFFVDSPYSKYEEFEKAVKVSNPELIGVVDLQHYHFSIGNWSKRKATKRADWLEEAFAWMKKDQLEGRLVTLGEKTEQIDAQLEYLRL